MVIGRNKSW